MLTKIPKGMKDVLPAESARWRAVENECRRAALLAGAPAADGESFLVPKAVE